MNRTDKRHEVLYGRPRCAQWQSKICERHGCNIACKDRGRMRGKSGIQVDRNEHRFMVVYCKANGLGILVKDILDNQGLLRAGRHEQDRVIDVLDNGIVHSAVAWEGELDQAFPVCCINSRL